MCSCLLLSGSLCFLPLYLAHFPLLSSNNFHVNNCHLSLLDAMLSVRALCQKSALLFQDKSDCFSKWNQIHPGPALSSIHYPCLAVSNAYFWRKRTSTFITFPQHLAQLAYNTHSWNHSSDKLLDAFFKLGAQDDQRPCPKSSAK